MKILIFAHIAPTGGTGTFFSNLVEHLNYLGHEIIVLDKKSTNPKQIRITKEKDFLRYAKKDNRNAFLLKVFRKLRLEDAYLALKDCSFTKPILQELKPDLCISSIGNGAEFSYLFFSDIPTLWFTHSTTFPLNRIEYKFIKNKFSDKKCNFKNKLFIFMSNFAKEQFINFSPFYRTHTNTQVIPNFTKVININTQKKQSDSISILTMGHLVEYKNPFIWLEVAKKITQNNPNVHFYWAGEGPLEDKIKKQVEDLENIHLLGYISREEAFSTCDIYFHPSKLETQGLTVIEAMALSIPCVVSNAGGLPESIDDKNNGFVCEKNDINEYITKLLFLINNKQQRKVMGKNAKKYFENKFTQSIWQERINNAIYFVLNKSEEK